MPSGTHVRRVPTDQLTEAETRALRRLLGDAFAADEHGGLTEDDWQHALGGVHFLVELDGTIATHASVVQRELQVAGVAVRTGYVEAVATAPGLQGRGYGSVVMGAVATYIAANFELGALGTGSQGFYQRLGWQVWRGPSGARTSDGVEPTPDEDGYILVLPTPSTPTLDLDASISCEWRPGDAW